MFGKIYDKAKIYGNLTREVSSWITNKKVVNHDNTQLPYDFNTIQLRTSNHLNLHKVNKNGWWESV